MTNAQFAKNNTLFQEACKAANTAITIHTSTGYFNRKEVIKMMVIFTSVARVPAFTVPEGMEVKLHAREWFHPLTYSACEIRVESMTTKVQFDIPVNAFKGGM
jgi:hypothetical protein